MIRQSHLETFSTAAVLEVLIIVRDQAGRHDESQVDFQKEDFIHPTIKETIHDDTFWAHEIN